MDLEKLYFEIKNHIDRVDFSQLWPGFEPLKFALYTDCQCFFGGTYVEKTDDFIGNTAIWYCGEWVAIWHVQEQSDPVVLTSKIIHEMFHGFQMIHKDSRFPDELDALYNYEYEEENLNLKLMENQWLCQLLTRFDKELFGEFLKSRRYRFDTFPYAYHYESCIEQIEGTANFVELRCLKQLSGERFEKALSAMRDRIVKPDNLLPIRVICYDIGALLLHVMTENNIAFDDGFSSLTFAEAILNDVEGKMYIPRYDMKCLLDHYNAKAKEVIGKAIEKNTLITDKPCDLFGVNIYDAVFCENHIISRYFVMFGSGDDQRIEYGDFVIETYAYRKASKIYRI